MNDLISRQAAIAAFKPYALYDSNRTNAEWVRRIELVLEALPSAEKHGKWIPFEFGDETWHKCTACGAADQYGTKHISHIPGKFHIVYAIRNYCPNCGARME